MADLDSRNVLFCIIKDLYNIYMIIFDWIIVTLFTNTQRDDVNQQTLCVNFKFVDKLKPKKGNKWN